LVTNPKCGTKQATMTKLTLPQPKPVQRHHECEYICDSTDESTE